jgi:hypothetical protein
MRSRAAVSLELSMMRPSGVTVIVTGADAADVLEVVVGD